MVSALRKCLVLQALAKINSHSVNRIVLSQAHALATDRVIADSCDAVMAIFLTEESLTVQTGKSILGFQHKLSFEQCNLRSGSSATPIEHRMHIFAQQLNRVCRLVTSR